MRTFAMKYGDNIRLLALVICFYILVVELSILMLWWQAAKRETKTKTTLLALKNVNIENKRLKTAENVQIDKRREVKPTNLTTMPKQDPNEAKKMDKEDVDLQIQKLLDPFSKASKQLGIKWSQQTY